jgi:hypothetical protein
MGEEESLPMTIREVSVANRPVAAGVFIVIVISMFTVAIASAQTETTTLSG